MQLSVREAADRVGVTRQTIFKKIKDGELSATVDHRGNKQVDITELLRVYGQLQSNDSQLSTTVNRMRQSKQSSQKTDLQLDFERSKMLLQMKDRELQLAHERIEELKARESELKQQARDFTEERLRFLGVIEAQNRLLSAPVVPQKAAKQVKPKSQPVARPKPIVKPQIAASKKAQIEDEQKATHTGSKQAQSRATKKSISSKPEAVSLVELSVPNTKKSKNSVAPPTRSRTALSKTVKAIGAKK